MNARQKAKKLKAENAKMKQLLDMKLVANGVRVRTARPELLRYKFLQNEFMPEDLLHCMIAKHFGDYLMENGFIDVKVYDYTWFNQKECVASMLAVHPAEANIIDERSIRALVWEDNYD